MSTNPEEKKENNEEKEEESEGGIFGKVKDLVQDIGEKIEETLGFGTPTADVTAVHIPSIDLKKAEIVVDVLIKNPNPIPIPLADIEYLVESKGRKLVSGLIPDSGTIHANGEETVKIPVTLIYEDIKNTYGEIKGGNLLPYLVKVGLIFDVPVFGRFTMPIEKEGEIPVPHKPGTSIDSIHFDRFSFEETVAVVNLKLENTNEFEFNISALQLEVWLGDENIGGAEFKSVTNKVDKNGVSSIAIPITFRPKDLGSAIWDIIRGKGTDYTMKGSIDVDTPYGNINFPIEKQSGQTTLNKNTEDNNDGDNKESESGGAFGFLKSLAS